MHCSFCSRDLLDSGLCPACDPAPVRSWGTFLVAVTAAVIVFLLLVKWLVASAFLGGLFL